MLETMLMRYCSPTLGGLKTGSLFTCPFPGEQEILSALLHWNQLLRPKGLCLLPLRRHRGRTLIYVYRPAFLARDLSHPKVETLLLQLGYPLPSAARCVAYLMSRLRSCESFPHEIGLFLGYPPADVQGFMEDPAACKYTGCWKVYENVNSARALFAKYRACAQYYHEQLSMGISLESLAASG